MQALPALAHRVPLSAMTDRTAWAFGLAAVAALLRLPAPGPWPGPRCVAPLAPGSEPVADAAHGTAARVVLSDLVDIVQHRGRTE